MNELGKITKKPNETWAQFLNRADNVCYKIKARNVDTDNCLTGTLRLFKNLVNIQDINGIQNKIRADETKFLELQGDSEITPWGLIRKVRAIIQTDARFWADEEKVDQTQHENRSFVAQSQQLTRTNQYNQNYQSSPYG